MTLRHGLALLLLVLLAFPACSAPSPRRALPPSASDLKLLGPVRLCDQQRRVERDAGGGVDRKEWGSGEELRLSRGPVGSEASYFFDQDGTLVGALFTFPHGLSLKPYPVLRQTLGQLKPSVEFYLRLGGVEQGRAETVSLYETGDEKSTTQYLVSAGGRQPTLLMASFALDPYVKLLSPYRPAWLSRLDPSRSSPSLQGAEDKESFPALQQFARGEMAHFASCETQNDARAAEAYAKALALGLTNPIWQAEAQYKLGLALHGLGRLEEAKGALQRSLALRPNSPELYNSLGAVFADAGDRGKAIEMFERSVVLRPNYAIARFNLAKAYEQVDARRAIAEYETFLALVEGIPEEEPRRLLASRRLAALKR